MYGDSVDPPQRQLRNSPGAAEGYRLAFTSYGEEPDSSYSENHRKHSPHGCPDNLTGNFQKMCFFKKKFPGSKKHGTHISLPPYGFINILEKNKSPSLTT